MLHKKLRAPVFIILFLSLSLIHPSQTKFSFTYSSELFITHLDDSFEYKFYTNSFYELPDNIKSSLPIFDFQSMSKIASAEIDPFYLGGINYALPTYNDRPYLHNLDIAVNLPIKESLTIDFLLGMSYGQSQGYSYSLFKLADLLFDGTPDPKYNTALSLHQLNDHRRFGISFGVTSTYSFTTKKLFTLVPFVSAGMGGVWWPIWNTDANVLLEYQETKDEQTVSAYNNGVWETKLTETLFLKRKFENIFSPYLIFKMGLNFPVSKRKTFSINYGSRVSTAFGKKLSVEKKGIVLLPADEFSDSSQKFEFETKKTTDITIKNKYNLSHQIGVSVTYVLKNDKSK